MKENLVRLLDYVEADEKKHWLEAGKPKAHIYEDIRALREWLAHPVVQVVVSQYRGLFDEDPQVFWNPMDALVAEIDIADRLDIPLKDGHPDLENSDNYVNCWECEIRNTEGNSEIEALKELKCAIKGCYNRKGTGVIYCNLHLHGGDARMSEASIAKLKAMGL